MRNESSFCLDFIFFLEGNYDICTHYQYNDQEAGSGMGCPYCQGTDKVYTSTKSSLNLYLHELVNYNYVIVSKVRDIRQEDMPRVCMWLRKQRDLHDARFVKIPLCVKCFRPFCGPIGPSVVNINTIFYKFEL